MTSETSPRPGQAPRRLGSADRELLTRLYETCFAASDGKEVLPWRYDQNPHGAAITLAQEGAAGQAIASYACNPRRVVPRGDESRAALVGQTGDVMTAVEARGKGLFSELDRTAMKAATEEGWPVVFGLPNRKSAPLFVEKLGWEDVGRIRPWTFVLTPDAGARAERIRAGRLASIGVPWAYWRGTKRRGSLRDRSFHEVTAVAIARFQPEVDEVWAEVARDWDWIVRRDHAWLNWRFLDAPSGRFRAHGVYNGEGKMRGYCVVQLPEQGKSTGFIVDLLGADEAGRCAALEAGLGHLLKAGASVARAHAMRGSWWEKTLRSAGFRGPKAEDEKHVILHVNQPDHPLVEVARHPERWYFTDADRDDELVR